MSKGDTGRCSWPLDICYVGFLIVSPFSVFIHIYNFKIYTPRHVPQEITFRQALLEGI